MLVNLGYLQNKRLQDHTVLTWQIWSAGCDGPRSKSYTISHVDTDNIPKILYEHHVNEDHREWKDDGKLIW